jgi:hypothetical protein
MPSGPRGADRNDTRAISTLDRLGQSIQCMPVFDDEPGKGGCDSEAQGAREPGMYRAVFCRRSQASMNKAVSGAKRPAIRLRAPPPAVSSGLTERENLLRAPEWPLEVVQNCGGQPYPVRAERNGVVQPQPLPFRAAVHVDLQVKVGE